MGTYCFILCLGFLALFAFGIDKAIAHTKGYVISQKGCTNHDVVLLLSSSSYFKLCENLTSEDNFNNTFFDKVLPHTTAVVTEFRGKGTSFFWNDKRMGEKSDTGLPYYTHLALQVLGQNATILF